MPITDYTTTILGWTVVAAGAGVFYLANKNDSSRQPIKAKAHQLAEETTRAAKEKQDRKTANREKQRERSAKKAAAAPLESANVLPLTDTKSDNSKRKEDDLRWATEAANRKKGTSLNAPNRKENKQKTVRQSNANKDASGPSAVTIASSADGEDDASSVASPNLSASGIAPTSGHVNDMLEPAESGPSVLRLTEPDNFIPVKSKKAPKAVQQEETKKQRQNRRKAEEKKLQREEEEQQRKVLAEKQRRTARESRGEPAKNGLGAPPASNAWTAPKPSAPASSNNQLLDTFAPQERSVKTNGANGKWQEHNLPSEEEQLRRIQEDDDSAWKTVSKKARTKRNTSSATEDEGSVKEALKPLVRPQADLSTPLYQTVPSAGNTNGTSSVFDDTDGWSVA